MNQIAIDDIIQKLEARYREEDAKPRMLERPLSWSIEYDDGADGCMPEGWYACGLDQHGFRIQTAYGSHEYGPFGTALKACRQAVRVDRIWREEESAAEIKAGKVTV